MIVEIIEFVFVDVRHFRKKSNSAVGSSSEDQRIAKEKCTIRIGCRKNSHVGHRKKQIRFFRILCDVLWLNNWLSSRSSLFFPVFPIFAGSKMTPSRSLLGFPRRAWMRPAGTPTCQLRRLLRGRLCLGSLARDTEIPEERERLAT
jgi:hypothetical protein